MKSKVQFKYKKSITKKMMLLFILIMLTLMSVLAMMNILFMKDYKIAVNKRKMITNSRKIERKLETKKVTKIQNFLFSLGESSNQSIRIVDPELNVVVNSAVPSKYEKNQNNHRKMDESTINAIIQYKEDLYKKGPVFIINYIDQPNKTHLLYMKKMPNGYIVSISRTMRSIDEDIASSNYFLLLTGSGIACIGIIVIYFFSKRFTKPIVEISNTATAIANLDFSKHVDIKSEDELGILATNINEISDRLSESINDLKSDITKRKQLVRDMSHELKTPITSIKGYTEALKFGVVKEKSQQERYYDIIVTECDRMAVIINEMMELSKMESVETCLEVSTFSIKDCFEEIRQQFIPLLSSKKITYQTEFFIDGIEQKEFMISADYNLLSRAIKNLVDNAIRYTPEEGTIRLTGKLSDGICLIGVFNTGNPIPQEEIESIWDVFYKADRSRKRENNNFGIGLAIVKSIVDHHKGLVDVRNMNDGVEFDIQLPQKKCH